MKTLGLCVLLLAFECSSLAQSTNYVPLGMPFLYGKRIFYAIEGKPFRPDLALPLGPWVGYGPSENK